MPHPEFAGDIEATRVASAPPGGGDATALPPAPHPADAVVIEPTLAAHGPPAGGDALPVEPHPHPFPATGIDAVLAAEAPPGGGDATPADDEPHPATARRSETTATPALTGRSLWRLLLVVSFGTAVASFIYEIAWIRMLSLVLGSATHSFELMLSAFILGLALGALWIRGRADRLTNPVRTLAAVQIVMGLAALATLPVYVASFGWMSSLLSALDNTEAGYRVFTVTRYALCLAVMLPATFCAGMTLPLITRTLLTGGMGERAIGAVYAVNTLGSIAGVVLAGLVLLPIFGLKGLLVEGAAVDMALGILLLRAVTDRGDERDRRLLLAGAAVAAAGVVIANFGVTIDPRLADSGVFRYGRLRLEGRRIDFHEDGRTATVTVGSSGGWTHIATNGKPDASLEVTWKDTTRARLAPRKPFGSDESTQALLPLLTLAHRPDAASAAVIGQGSGMTSHFLLASPRLREVVTIEIEPAMIAGSRVAFYPANRRVFDDPRSHFVVDDAKSYFASGRRRFDIIVSEPSNPWVSGVSGLFTEEFYDRVRQYLAPNGLFAQWLHLYEIDDDLVVGVLAALHRSFPSYAMFQTSRGDILILASMERRLPEPDWRVFAIPGIAADLAHIVPFSPRQLAALRVLDRDALAPLLDGWTARNSDFHPSLDLGAERTRYLRVGAEGITEMLDSRWDIVAPFFGGRRGFGDALATPVPHIARAYALVTGAAVREPRGAVDSTRFVTETSLATALQRRWTLDATLAAGDPPRDWRLWLNTVMAAETERHAGTAGVVDTAFFDAVQRFAERNAAPRDVRESLAFVRAAAGWSWADAARLADVLADSAARGRSPLDPDVIRDNGVVAKLRVGDPAGARRLFTRLAPRSERKPGDFRTRLLDAYIRAAERERRG
jgi:predicted membrane-bound spermidine synthase